MGFFSNLLSAAAPIISGFLGGGAAQVATTALVPAAPQQIVQQPQGAVQTVPQTTVQSIVQAFNPVAAVAPLAIQGIDIAQAASATVAAQAGVGQANIFTRTIVQRVSRLSGNVLSQRVLRGSPFLMNSEVRSLRRITKMINKAHGKIGRKPARVSEEMLDDAVSKRLQQLNAAQCLVANGSKC